MSSVPKPIVPPEESIVTLPADCKSNVVPVARVIPPAVEVKAIADPALPEVFVRDIVSLPAVPLGENIISVAPFFPNLRVCPSAKSAPIVIDPVEESIEALPVALTSNIPVELNVNACVVPVEFKVNAPAVEYIKASLVSNALPEIL